MDHHSLLAPPLAREAASGTLRNHVASCLLVASLAGFALSSALAQSSPDPAQELQLAVDADTTSSGSATVSNTSGTFHYKGELTCVSTCPGPEPDGCSATDTWVQVKQLAPGQSSGCTMFALTDPCCQDDGNYVLSARFTAQYYRESPTGAWVALETINEKGRSESNEDAGSGHPNPNPNVAIKAGHLLLELVCGIPLLHPVQSKFTVRNTSSRFSYRVRMRTQAVCPSDIQESVCPCPGPGGTPPGGYCFAPPVPENCNADPNKDQAIVIPDCTVAYPLEYVVGDSSIDPSDPNSPKNMICAEDPATPGWIWCEKLLLPQEFVTPQEYRHFNSCCDCDQVQNTITCGELDTTHVLKPNSDSEDVVNSQGFDKVGKCKIAENETVSKDFECFSTKCPDL